MGGGQQVQVLGCLLGCLRQQRTGLASCGTHLTFKAMRVSGLMLLVADEMLS